MTAQRFGGHGFDPQPGRTKDCPIASLLGSVFQGALEGLGIDYPMIPECGPATAHHSLREEVK